MRFKFLVLLFLGFLPTFFERIKAEEICYYSTRQEHRKCKKEELKSIPKYPIENFHSDAYVMGQGIPAIDFSAIGSVYKIFEFKAYDSENLQITSGTKSMGLLAGLTWRRPWINKKTFTISPEKIIYLNKSDAFIATWPKPFIVRKYSFKYIDDFGEVDSIEFQQTLISNKEKKVFDLIGDYLLHVSNLKWGEEIPAGSKIEKYLKENEKFLTITKSIILENNNFTNRCFIAKDSKFPELTERYKKIYGTINPLRAKLDLPPSSAFMPICN